MAAEGWAGKGYDAGYTGTNICGIPAHVLAVIYEILTYNLLFFFPPEDDNLPILHRLNRVPILPRSSASTGPKFPMPIAVFASAERVKSSDTEANADLFMFFFSLFPASPYDFFLFFFG